MIDRSQCVSGMISKLYSSTGSPQGCVLSPILLTLYNNDCRNTCDGRCVFKCAYDSVIVSVWKDNESEHGLVEDDSLSWCDEFHLGLMQSKLKTCWLIFRRTHASITYTNIHDTQYEYLGSVIDNKLPIESNADMMCKNV